MRVISKKIIKLETPVPVYDLTSPKHHNYILDNGAVVHNSAKKARDIHTQAVFPLKGKPLNVMDADQEKILNNNEVQLILAALGVDIDKPDPSKTVPYRDIIIMADGDVDGKHINTLLLTLFYKFIPQIFEDGKLYVMKGPEYLARYKGKTVFGSSKKSVLKKLKVPSSESKKVEIKHIKGWGEMNPDDLAIAAMEPAGRTLYKVKPIGSKDAPKFEMLMGKKSTYRKQLLGVTSGDTTDE